MCQSDGTEVVDMRNVIGFCAVVAVVDDWVDAAGADFSAEPFANAAWTAKTKATVTTAATSNRLKLIAYSLFLPRQFCISRSKRKHWLLFRPRHVLMMPHANPKWVETQAGLIPPQNEKSRQGRKPGAANPRVPRVSSRRSDPEMVQPRIYHFELVIAAKVRYKSELRSRGRPPNDNSIDLGNEHFDCRSGMPMDSLPAVRLIVVGTVARKGSRQHLTAPWTEGARLLPVSGFEPRGARGGAERLVLLDFYPAKVEVFAAESFRHIHVRYNLSFRYRTLHFILTPAS